MALTRVEVLELRQHQRGNGYRLRGPGMDTVGQHAEGDRLARIVTDEYVDHNEEIP